MYNLRYLLAALLSVIPINKVRVILYKVLFNYNISLSAKIGMFTIIVVDNAIIGSCIVGRFNKICGTFSLEIKDNSMIGNKNEISSNNWMPKANGRSVKIGKDTLITCNHFIDGSGNFELGDGSWIAGRASQFWVHGRSTNSAKGRDVVIGKNCYISSGSRFAPGSSIADNSMVAIGAVVSKDFKETNILIGGVPAKYIKDIESSSNR